jgi:lipopolysaccharide biosynthesis glycosyltransferase
LYSTAAYAPHGQEAIRRKRIAGERDLTPLDGKNVQGGTRERAYLLMCCDAGYFQHIAVCLTSLLEHNGQIDFETVILVTRYTADGAEKLRRSLARHQNLALRLVAFDSSRLTGLPLKNSYPLEIYARFWVADYFGDDVDRVIYLDGDMIVVGSIQELLTLPLNDNVLAAVSIPGSVRAAVLGYDAAYEYFNSGVLVINLKRWRKIDARDLLISTAHRIAAKLSDPDQDVLNYCFFSQRVKLDFTWNAITPFFREINFLAIPKEEVARVARDARIVHFNGASKPWQYLCRHPLKKDYLRYLAQTEWRDFRPDDYNITNVFKRFFSSLLGERNATALTKMRREFFPGRG